MFGIFSPMIARTPSAKVDGTKNQQLSHATSVMIANSPPNPIWSSPMARMLRRNSTPRRVDLATSRSSSAGTNTRIKALGRDAKNHVVQPIRKKPHAAGNPVSMLSLMGGIGILLPGLSVTVKRGQPPIIFIANVFGDTAYLDKFVNFCRSQRCHPPCRLLIGDSAIVWFCRSRWLKVL